MRYLLLALVLVLPGCSSFMMGGVVYCPYGADCIFQQTTPSRVPQDMQLPLPPRGFGS